MKIKIGWLFCFVSLRLISWGQTYSEILGRPTDTTVTMSILFDQGVDVYWELGTTSGNYSSITDTISLTANLPVEKDFTGLTTNTQYYYRTRFRLSGSGSSFSAGTEHSFHTRRPAGSSFSFAVEADPHLDSNTIPASYTLTLQNMLSKKPDFVIDLGDNFMSEKQPVINQQVITDRTVMFRPYFNQVCHSAPLYLTIGNHEGELGWMLNGTDTCLPVRAALARKLYYPNPYPNSFYSGNNVSENYVGLRENYYGWQWGDALFMVIDPYWYTTNANRAGWGWTLGSTQFNWFKSTLRNSTAKYKFIFCHQLVGGNGNDARGGSEFVDLFENGGQNLDTTWGFDTKRPHWEEPLHALMLENKVSIYFHGHDHCYAKQDKDGIVYQEVPQPSAKNINIFTGSQAGYGYVNGVLLPSRGFLLVKVSSDSVHVDYVKTYLPNEENGTRHNLDIAHAYVIKDTIPAPVTNYTFNGNGNWTLASNWVGNNIPPKVLPAGDSIIIDPVVGGKCVLNITQIIADGATIIVNPGKNLVVPGSLIKH